MKHRQKNSLITLIIAVFLIMTENNIVLAFNTSDLDSFNAASNKFIFLWIGLAALLVLSWVIIIPSRSFATKRLRKNIRKQIRLEKEIENKQNELYNNMYDDEIDQNVVSLEKIKIAKEVINNSR